jgi:hypothetical protein
MAAILVVGATCATTVDRRRNASCATAERGVGAQSAAETMGKCKVYAGVAQAAVG